MIVLVCYDIATADQGGPRRLRHVAEACADHGIRVQYSVFECRVQPHEWVFLRRRLLAEYEPARDSLRFYFLDADDTARTEHHGVRPPVDVAGPLVV